MESLVLSYFNGVIIMFNEKTQMYDGIIYCFTNKINNKKYVGQTQQTLKQRISNHLSKTNKKYYFQNALLKYGIDNFNIEILESISADTKNNLKLRLNKREKFYILKYKLLIIIMDTILLKVANAYLLKMGEKFINSIY